MRSTPRSVVALCVLAYLAACAGSGPEDDGFGGISTGASDTGAGETGGDGADGGGDRYDVLNPDGDTMPCAEGGPCPECEAPQHVACDDGSTDPFRAMGLGCPDDPEVTSTMEGSPDAVGVRSQFGATSVFDPREGSLYAVISSGLVSELDSETPDFDKEPDYAPHSAPTYCNDDLGDEWDPKSQLPMPLRTNDVGPTDCAANPGLVGTGDCSNTIHGQFSQGQAAYDYTELRMQARVPDTASSFSYDFAFHSTEYPFYYGSSFNDMYVAWLESEQWTGNVSFDEQGNPISLNAGFLDFRDDAGSVPEFAGTCMRYHAGTKWLTTNAPVEPGEDITVVFAIFDLADSILDSYVFLDNWRWGCDGDVPPETKPVG